MRNESVAVLDVRSYEVTFLIGAKGVNDTFVFRDGKSEKYEGYTSEGFLDVESFRRAVISAVSSVRDNYGGVLKEISVGVPVAFTSLQTKGHTISFPSKRKISATEVDELYESGLKELLAKGRYMRRSEMYFALGDNRKYFSAADVYGKSSPSLKGALCYYFLDEKFYETTDGVLRELGFEEVRFIPQSLAQAEYLLPQKVREGYAFLLDMGFLSTSFSVVYGNGIVHEDSFDFGTGQIVFALMDTFGATYETALEILAGADISGGIVAKELTWTDGEGKEYSVREINETIKYCLNSLCESVENFFDKYYRGKNTANFAANPISVTGEGVGEIRGSQEYLSKMLGRVTRVVCPDLPMFDKPVYSSRIALISTALSEKKKKGAVRRLFQIFGGKR